MPTRNASSIIVPLLSASLLFVCCTQVTAQEIPTAEATKQHKWLKKMAGKWESKSSAAAAPGQDAVVMTGTIESSLLGEFWLINTMKAEMNGFKIEGRQTVGYDRKKEKYIGTWVDNTSDFIWHYEGTVSEDGSTLSLLAEGPDMADPDKKAMYRDMYQFTSDDTIDVSSSVKGPDGKWIVFMKGKAKRVK